MKDAIIYLSLLSISVVYIIYQMKKNQESTEVIEIQTEVEIPNLNEL